MTLNLRTYSNLVTSDYQWFGKVPEHWEVLPVKRLFNIGRGRVIAETELVDDGLYPVYSSQTKNDGCLGFINSYDFDSSQLTWTTDGANAGTVFYRSGKYNCTNVCGTLLPKYPKKLDLKYFLYSLGFTAQYHKRPDTNGAKIMNGEMSVIKLLVPPIEEQVLIRQFLDLKTATIDELIQKQEKLILLLYEKMHASAIEMVTHGLNQKKFKPVLNVFWINQIPSHWSVERIKTIFEIKKRIAGKLGFDVLSITQNGIKVKDIESNEGQQSMDYSKYQIVEKGDFAMNHMDLLTGYVDIANQDGVTSPDYRVFTIRNEAKYYPNYYLLLLQLCYKSKLFYPFGQGSSQLGRWRLPTDAFNQFFYPVPPYDEQVAY